MTQASAGANVADTAWPNRKLGRTGASLFPVGLGAMPLSMGKRPKESAAIATIHAALAAGMNFIDTANVYCATDDEIGHNERLIRKALKTASSGQEVTVAAKGGVDRIQGRVNASPAFLRKSCIDSLLALGQESIFLYQLHAPDDEVPLEESIGELLRLQEEGKIVHIGLCNVSVDQLVLAQDLGRIESVQNACNPVDAEEYQNGMLEICLEQEISFIPHSVAGGAQYHAKLAQLPFLTDMAEKYAVSPYAIIIAWHLAQSPWILPIPGASKTASVYSSASAANIILEASDLAELDDFAYSD